jgi:hypothetical protein
MKGGLNSINGSIPSKIELILFPFKGGRISKENNVDLAFLMWSITFTAQIILAAKVSKRTIMKSNPSNGRTF